MKGKIVLILFSIIFSRGLTQDTIPNQSFENWGSQYFVMNWETINNFLPSGFYACERTQDAFSGSYAMKLETIEIEGTLAPGVATIGDLEYYYTSGGVPYSQRPSVLKAHIKHPSSGDEIMISVEFFKDGVEIGGGVLQFYEEISEYTEVSIPISFLQNFSPDTLNIIVLTDISKVGSTLYIDNLMFDFTSQIDSRESNELDFSVFPNPCSDYLRINSNEVGEFKYEIFNLRGERLFSDMSLKGERINMKNFISGTYLFVCWWDEKKYKELIIVR